LKVSALEETNNQTNTYLLLNFGPECEKMRCYIYFPLFTTMALSSDFIWSPSNQTRQRGQKEVNWEKEAFYVIDIYQCSKLTFTLHSH